MLPLQQAREVKDSVIEYIKATFRFKEKDVNDAFYRFIEDGRDGLFKGPYISLKTPFVSATEEETASIPLDIAPKFSPYRHQLQAFGQLTMKDGHRPEPTLLTTGTGSGKTECFLYPILDYCYHCNRYEHQPGIKAIILYPMNALATDQAKRLAQTIYNDSRLNGKITAGLFVGEGIDAKDYPRDMGEDHIIENRDTILDVAPDIVLTNFKMLDYGLMRQTFMKLWRGNIDSDQKPLRFIVLDELHTYDGAQGTDVANLIRRLKLKLHLPDGWLCPVGTSATIGNGADSKRRLCDYAADVFGEPFSEENVIEEHRIPVEEYVIAKNFNLPDGQAIKECVFKSGDTVPDYIRKICRVWLRNGAATPEQVGNALREMEIVKDLLSALKDGVLTLEELQNRLEDNAGFRRLRQRYSEKVCITAVEHLLALIAYAKLPGVDENHKSPMLYLQVQLWQRELSGILRYVQKEPEFVWRGSIKAGEDRVALPMWFCRDCGASGWISHRLATDDKYSSDIKKINIRFADRDKDVVLLNIGNGSHTPIEEYSGENASCQSCYVRLNDLSDANRNDENVIKLVECCKYSSLEKGSQRFSRACPECNGQDTVSQVGGRTSTLSSVAVSQVLSTEFDSSDERERKMLVFTNSVQDAAYQAGYYEARTFRFIFRQSMQKYINTLDRPVNIPELQSGFRAFWHKELEEKDYYDRFLPADLASHLDLKKNYHQDERSFMAGFREEFELRVDWEILTEFALSSQLGRTLEKTGASAAFFRPEPIHEVFSRMKDWLNENNMESVAAREDDFCHFVYGILQRMRIHGGVDHPFLQKYRNESLTIWGLNWSYPEKRHFLNKNLGGSMQFPKLVGTYFTDRNGDMLDMACLRNERRPNWYYNYFNKCFRRDSDNVFTKINIFLFNEFVRQLFDTMVEVGLLNKGTQGAGNYAICPEQILVSRKVKHVQCNRCQSMLYVADEDEFAEGTKCLDYKCEGTYLYETKPELNYYQQVYNRSKSPRVHAHEHTGLLNRKDREEIETDFKEHPNPDSLNVLTATSTLEMGIDIGDLNVVGNTNIPPKPGNFLQRIGRAGRKEGSALVLNYSHAGEPHDMYYFTYPDEMMQGEINTPGCFLEARDILRRHFLAFCIDSWVSEDENNDLPRRIRDLRLTSEDVFSSDLFVLNRILTFIKVNKVSLRSAFCSQYGERTQDALAKLFVSLDDESFYNHFIGEFKRLREKLLHLGKELEQYKDQKKHIQKNDEVNIAAMENLIRATNKQYGLIMETRTIEYMTDVGLLPNYAFPETGVELEASIYSHREKCDSDNNIVEPKAVGLVRAASQGIRELAPGNKFYTQKYKLDISGLSTFDWKESKTQMRCCSECDCFALEGEPGYDSALCPKCGDPSWGMSVHPVLKFTGARSVMSNDKAALDDSREDRESEQYIVRKHFMFRHTGVVTSYAMRGVGFGIEFCNNLDLYEVNYGMETQAEERKEVDKALVPDNGFITCRYCGKTTHLLSQAQTADKQHYKFCTHNDISFQDDREKGEVFEKLYLYRHLKTEAIKILLPIQIMDSDSYVEMFKAGIELGMKEYYKSSPEHIRIDHYLEKNPVTADMDHYLVMYDTIPGGTGYLAKLFNPVEFSAMLEKAYQRIHDCSCQLEGKDGCYHCIMSYGNRYKREDFSREQADALFEKLVAHKNSWDSVSGSVGSVSQSGGAEDSELELKFVRALKTIAMDRHWEFEKVPDLDSYRYDLHIVNEEDDTDIRYYVRPQFELTGAYGVSHYTVPDFQIICASARIFGKDVPAQGLPMWSVFLDGYSYHAKAPNVRFYGDKQKRDGIRDSKLYRMYSWTLTWEDIKLFEEGKEDSLEHDSVSRLIELLQNPQGGNLLETALNHIPDFNQFLSNGGSLYKGELQVDESVYDNLTEDSTDAEVEAALRNCVIYDWHLTEGLHDIDKEEWIGFWRRYDILQFFANERPAGGNCVDSYETIDRDEIKIYYPGLEEIVDILLDNGIEFSHDGDVDLVDEEGIVIATAGMLLEKYKVAIDPAPGTEEIFVAHGYEIMDSKGFNLKNLIG
ncbi:MAG: DEAD/DEAH box helicase [Clostridia bacterium]|nr:DEAD/DEAH box helicase [Clostridia bacterium]